MDSKRGPMFPKINIMTSTAQRILNGQEASEEDLRELERHILGWILTPKTCCTPIQATDEAGKIMHSIGYVMEIPEVAVGTGRDVYPIHITAQRSIRVNRLLLFSKKSLASIKIHRLMIGCGDPFHIVEGVSADLFRVMNPQLPLFKHDNFLNPGMRCTLYVENTSDELVDLSGVLVGETLQF